MGDVIDIKSRRKKVKFITLPNVETETITIDVNELDFDKENYKSCKTCIHYDIDKIYGQRCMFYPVAEFHSVTVQCCHPNNGKVLWYPKNGLKVGGFLSKLLNFFSIKSKPKR